MNIERGKCVKSVLGEYSSAATKVLSQI